MKNKIKELNDKLNDSHTQNLDYKNKIDVADVELKNQKLKFTEQKEEFDNLQKKYNKI